MLALGSRWPFNVLCDKGLADDTQKEGIGAAAAHIYTLLWDGEYAGEGENIF